MATTRSNWHQEMVDPRIVNEIIEATREAVQTGDPAPLHAPSLNGNESKYLTQAVESTFVSSVGPFVERLESDLASITGAKRVIATSSGTSALQLALRLAGVNQGDEVLMPSLTFVATANAVSYLGAFPHFVDIEYTSLGIDPIALRTWLSQNSETTKHGLRNKSTGRVIRALVPMHAFGHPSKIDELCQVAQDFQLVVVEDAAESLGSMFQNRHTGTFGLLGAISFNGNKIVTTGGGGAILTDDEELADFAKHLSTTAKVPDSWDYVHDEIGYNFRMPNINAALGVAQLERLPEFIESKRSLALRYNDAFAKVKVASVIAEPEGAFSNYWLNTLRLNEEFVNSRETIIQGLNDSGLGARPVWNPLHTLVIYKEAFRGPLPVTESLSRLLINLPSGAGLT